MPWAGAGSGCGTTAAQGPRYHANVSSPDATWYPSEAYPSARRVTAGETGLPAGTGIRGSSVAGSLPSRATRFFASWSKLSVAAGWETNDHDARTARRTDGAWVLMTGVLLPPGR